MKIWIVEKPRKEKEPLKRKGLQNLILICVFTISFLVVAGLGFYQGKKLTSVSEQGIELTEKHPVGERTPQKEEETSIVVFVTPSGSKYHLYKDCSSLSRAKEIRGMILYSVKEEGYTLCSFCEKRGNT